MKNSGAVANELGISQSTVKRWVTACNLEIERNSHGHYLFTDTDIEQLKQIQQQLNEGVSLQRVEIKEKSIRKGVVQTNIQPVDRQIDFVKLQATVQDLERRIDEKADAVASYQLLQHRREIEDLQKQIDRLNKRIEELEDNSMNESNRIISAKSLVFDGNKNPKKQKKRHIFQTLFGF